MTESDKEAPAEKKSSESDGIWLSNDGYLVLNFEIIAYKGNTPYLAYGSDKDPSDMWGIQAGLGINRSSLEFTSTSDIDLPDVRIGDKFKNGTFTITPKRGDIAYIDLSHSLSDRYGAGQYIID